MPLPPAPMAEKPSHATRNPKRDTLLKKGEKPGGSAQGKSPFPLNARLPSPGHGAFEMRSFQKRRCPHSRVRKSGACVPPQGGSRVRRAGLLFTGTDDRPAFFDGLCPIGAKRSRTPPGRAFRRPHPSKKARMRRDPRPAQGQSDRMRLLIPPRFHGRP